MLILPGSVIKRADDERAQERKACQKRVNKYNTIRAEGEDKGTATRI